MEPLDVLGWISSVLVVVSLMVARVLRFRLLNLAGAGLATVVNALLGIWPFAVMNGAIAVIDAYWIWRLLRERHDVNAYEVVEVDLDDAYVRHWLDLKAGGVRPNASQLPVPGATDAADRSGFLIMRGDETVGMVVVRDAGAGVGEVGLRLRHPAVPRLHAGGVRLPASRGSSRPGASPGCASSMSSPPSTPTTSASGSARSTGTGSASSSPQPERCAGHGSDGRVSAAHRG